MSDTYLETDTTAPSEEQVLTERARERAAGSAFRQFNEARGCLGEFAEQVEEAEDAVKTVDTEDFPSRRSRMRQACAAVVSCGTMIGLSTLIACFATQEFAFDLSGLLLQANLLNAEDALALATGVLVACFTSALLIAKGKTDYSQDRVSLKTCAADIRPDYRRKIALKAGGKVAYLVCLGCIYWHFHQRHSAAMALVERESAPLMALRMDLGSAGQATYVAPAPPKPANLRGLGSRDGLYLLDVGLHGLVIFGLGGVTLRGLNWSLAFASPIRRKRRLAKLRHRRRQAAELVLQNLDARRELLNSVTEEEKELLNRVYGREVIALSHPEAPTSAVVEPAAVAEEPVAVNQTQSGDRAADQLSPF